MEKLNSGFAQKMGVKGVATAGLLFITFLAAIQYVFLANVPESLSAYSFVFITNLIGMAILFVTRIKHIFLIRKKTLLKGAFFAFLLTGFNLFTLLGSRGMDSVAVSSVVSLYFVFVTPILLLLRKKVNFFSGIATVMAIISLLLIFGGNIEALFQSMNVIYLVIADICFAVYVVAVSNLGADEDSSALTFSQMGFSAGISLVAWMIEASLGKATMAIPTDRAFWISAIFIGIFIRAIYGILQISCQKHVSELSASLIFSTEIIITMLMDPILCKILGTTHTPASLYQVVGALFLIMATLMVDDQIMSKVGYVDMDRPSVSKKMVVNTLLFSMITLIISMVISLSAIYVIQDSAVDGSTSLGEDAAAISTDAMTVEIEESTTMQVTDKAKLAEQKLAAYAMSVGVAADYATSLYQNASRIGGKEVGWATEENANIWAMQRLLENTDITYESVRKESALLGNMEDVFSSIIEKNPNVLTIYLGTESGLMVSYDPYSQLALGEENHFYEYKESEWYNLGKKADDAVFTSTYWDGYGRGLTITCVAPFYDASGKFTGCMAMDILMSDLNASMVSDGIVDPNIATMIDSQGNIIASKDLDPNTEQTFSIFDESRDSALKGIGKEILKQKNGILQEGEGEDGVYVAFASIDSTGWILCIISPVSLVIAPANEIRDSINTNTTNVANSVMMAALHVIQNLLVLSAIILLIITVSAGPISRRISEPLRKLTEDVMEISGGNLDRRTDVATDDEIGELAGSFNHMTDSLQKYFVDLKEATAKEERIASELSVATNIQASMLPRSFDEYNKRKEFSIYATMDPAKEVGGDFYDFFMIDEDHLGLVMADVSGKGVPASLFMVVAKTLIKNRAQLGGTPSEVLAYANEQLCENNDADLFVTVWFAVLDLKTGKGLAANAGHEHPAIRRANGAYELLVYKHSMAVAVLDGVPFEQHEFELHPGDALFVYTDGVPEATDAKEELYGTDRLIAALNENVNATPQEVLQNVRKDIDTFVGDAEQFDDITMMSLVYHGV